MGNSFVLSKINYLHNIQNYSNDKTLLYFLSDQQGCWVIGRSYKSKRKRSDETHSSVLGTVKQKRHISKYLKLEGQGDDNSSLNLPPHEEQHGCIVSPSDESFDVKFRNRHDSPEFRPAKKKMRMHEYLKKEVHSNDNTSPNLPHEELNRSDSCPAKKNMLISRNIKQEGQDNDNVSPNLPPHQELHGWIVGPPNKSLGVNRRHSRHSRPAKNRYIKAYLHDIRGESNDIINRGDEVYEWFNGPPNTKGEQNRDSQDPPDSRSATEKGHRYIILYLHDIRGQSKDSSLDSRNIKRYKEVYGWIVGPSKTSLDENSHDGYAPREPYASTSKESAPWYLWEEHNITNQHIDSGNDIFSIPFDPVRETQSSDPSALPDDITMNHDPPEPCSLAVQQDIYQPPPWYIRKEDIPERIKHMEGCNDIFSIIFDTKGKTKSRAPPPLTDKRSQRRHGSSASSSEDATVTA